MTKPKSPKLPDASKPESGAAVGSTALFGVPTRIQSAVRWYEQNDGWKFPVPRHQALKMRSLGKVGIDIMIQSGLIVLDKKDMANVDLLKRQIAHLEDRLDRRREELRLIISPNDQVERQPPPPTQ